MSSREAICYVCNHQFRVLLAEVDHTRVRTKEGQIIEVDYATCPQCGTAQFLASYSLKGLDTGLFERTEFRI